MTAWFFAVVVPLVLVLVFFPAPFGSFSEGGGGLLLAGWNLKAFFLVSFAMAIGAFALGHLTREHQPLWAGALVAAGLVAAALGVLILPATLIGILFSGSLDPAVGMLLALLGLSPFAAAAYYFSGAVHLYSSEVPSPRPRRAVAGFALFIVLAGGVQLAATNAYESSLEQSLSPEAEVRNTGVKRLERWAFLLSPLRMQAEYSETSDPVIKARIENAYYLVTGNEIEPTWTSRSE